jgi:septal ring factor EnvC (AmiA/AmiB activator)
MHRSRKSAVFEMRRPISPFIPTKAGIQKAKDWVPAFAGTNGWCVALIVLAASTHSTRAQDVRGLEVCTAEKQMERRTSCLQANIDFLQNLIDRNARDARQKLDTATKELAAARNEVATMKASLAALQARLEKLEKPEKREKPNGDAQKK